MVGENSLETRGETFFSTCVLCLLSLFLPVMQLNL